MSALASPHDESPAHTPLPVSASPHADSPAHTKYPARTSSRTESHAHTVHAVAAYSPAESPAESSSESSSESPAESPAHTPLPNPASPLAESSAHTAHPVSAHSHAESPSHKPHPTSTSPLANRTQSLSFANVADFVSQKKKRLSLSMTKMSNKQKKKKEEDPKADTPAFTMHPGTPVRYDQTKDNEDSLLEQDPRLKSMTPFQRLAAGVLPKGSPGRPVTPPDPFAPSASTSPPSCPTRPPPPPPVTPTRALRNMPHAPTAPFRPTPAPRVEQESEGSKGTDELPQQKRDLAAQRGPIGTGHRRARAQTINEYPSTASQVAPRSNSTNHIENATSSPMKMLGRVFGGRSTTPAAPARPPKPETPDRPPVKIIRSPMNDDSRRVAHFGYADMMAAGGDVSSIAAIPKFQESSGQQANARYTKMMDGLKSDSERKAEELEILKAAFAKIATDLKADAERKDQEITALKAAVAALSVGKVTTVAKSTWEMLESKGLLKNILGRLAKKDLCSLTRVSKYMKSVAEPVLYKELDFSPKLPHEFSYAYLTFRLTKLLRAGNGPKLAKYTTYFRVGSGWQENAIIYLDSSNPKEPARPLTSPKNIKDGELEWSMERLKALLDNEGVQGGDGGAKEAKAYMNAVLNFTEEVETLIWDSPIPLKINNNGIPFKLVELKTLKMNLGTPTTLPSREPGKEAPKLYSYRPNISFLRFCCLVTLNLYNIATRDSCWWSHIYLFVSRMASSLRHLTLEMCPIEDITAVRFPQLFVPGQDLDGLRNPVHIGWDNRFSVAGGKGLRIETLQLRGFIVSEDTFDDVLDPEVLRTVKLFGCMRMKEWEMSNAHARHIKNFETDGWGFLGSALRIAKHDPKEIVFTPTETRPMEEALGELVKRSMTISKLKLSAVCFVETDAIKVFVGSGNGVRHLEIALKREQWDHFVWNLHNLRHIVHVTVFVDEGGKKPTKGHRKRYPADDAEEMVTTMGPKTLREVGVGGHVWAIKWVNKEKFKLVKIQSVPANLSRQDLAGATKFLNSGAKLVDVRRKVKTTK
ncbi:hypothetical protein BZA05DRAFT_450759 [Tricharina praecox]|uniref:uncharacterized protein n=1 Tax=Tricharina praecox TaxID=43433 RepID=UPI00221E6811|nr:uncharacterized protein BZA05DRAFT_450759 [Tricharina praecox]KAI5858840.1 hypothetical protein BZA05DRAFT_450759 [Tricharina praecox]